VTRTAVTDDEWAVTSSGTQETNSGLKVPPANHRPEPVLPACVTPGDVSFIHTTPPRPAWLDKFPLFYDNCLRPALGYAVTCAGPGASDPDSSNRLARFAGRPGPTSPALQARHPDWRDGTHPRPRQGRQRKCGADWDNGKKRDDRPIRTTARLATAVRLAGVKRASTTHRPPALRRFLRFWYELLPGWRGPPLQTAPSGKFISVVMCTQNENANLCWASLPPKPHRALLAEPGNADGVRGLRWFRRPTSTSFWPGPQ